VDGLDLRQVLGPVLTRVASAHKTCGTRSTSSSFGNAGETPIGSVQQAWLLARRPDLARGVLAVAIRTIAS
jgi:hypothetical protein